MVYITEGNPEKIVDAFLIKLYLFFAQLTFSKLVTLKNGWKFQFSMTGIRVLLGLR